MRTWSTRTERPLGRSQRLRLTEKTDLIVHRATTESELTRSDALIVKAYAMSAPTARFVGSIGDVLTASDESKTR